MSFYGSAARGQAILLVLSGRITSAFHDVIWRFASKGFLPLQFRNPRAMGKKGGKKKALDPEARRIFSGGSRQPPSLARPQPGKQQQKMKKRSGDPAQEFRLASEL